LHNSNEEAEQQVTKSLLSGFEQESKNY